jgi:hypothetical protein
MMFQSNVLGTVRLAQQAPEGPSWWPEEAQKRPRRGPEEAQKTVKDYDDLLGRVAQIASADARGEILSWIGRSDVPGSPAERYKTVADALSQGAPSSDVLRKRLDDLEAAVGDLKAKVSNAEQSYGTLSSPAGGDSTPGAAGMMAKCVLGGLALLGLVVIPLLSD